MDTRPLIDKQQPMSCQITGRLTWKGEKQQKTSGAGNPYLLQEFILNYYEGEYEYLVGFVAYNKSTAIIDRLLIDDIVAVKFRPVSSTNNGKIYTTLNAWSIQPQWNQMPSTVTPPSDTTNAAV
jgi:hypothetical protein